MSPTGLQQFVDAKTAPQKRTRRKVGEKFMADLEEQRERKGGKTRRVREWRPSLSAVEERLRKLFESDPKQAARELKRFFRRRAGEPVPDFIAELEEILVQFVRQLPQKRPPDA